MVTVDFNRIPLQPGDCVLDIGCGTGRHMAAAYQLPGITVVGVDISRNDIQDARGRMRFHDQLGAHGGGIWLLSVSSITNLPFMDATFDGVICSEVLEHIPDEKTAIQEIIRVLKPGKTLAVSVPRYFPERICWLLSDAYHQTANGHIRIYHKRQLIKTLKIHGAQRVASHFAHGIHTPFWWLKCLAGIHRGDVALVNAYHRLLTWDIMKRPAITRFLDRLMNPLLGKSLVLYCHKQSPDGHAHEVTVRGIRQDRD